MVKVSHNPPFLAQLLLTITGQTLPIAVERIWLIRAKLLVVMTAPFIPEARVRRLRLSVRGVVQGVGYRPFVFRLANDLGLTGWVNNSPAGVNIEVEGEPERLHQFQHRLATEKPAHSRIQALEADWLEAAGYATFEIRASSVTGASTALVLPDIATCPHCLREVFDPANRRFHYPFTNCTHCGPRFSILNALPYDRANTSMRGFKMCPQCQAEYDDPGDRRFHAQPNACPVCGPRLEFWSADGEVTFGAYEALLAAAQALRRGKIVAVKGIGGFHLLVDARNEAVVRRLRQRKQRAEKPFALMFPSVAMVRAVCQVSPLEEQLLRSPAAPIVLLDKIRDRAPGIAAAVAPGHPNFGILLPANPLHHLLMAAFGHPVVATSGNLSDEPICTDELEAMERLGGIADWYLVHDRPIVRPEDDSITRVMVDREVVLRRSRGYAPLPVTMPPAAGPAPAVLAVGAHLKNTVALAVGDNVLLSQHLGDLATEPAHAAFRRACADLPRLYQVQPAIIAADLHPDYLSTQFAHRATAQVFGVQHHVAHVLSCIAEHHLELPVLGVAWDGTGYGADGTLWGGEFFRVTADGVERVAHLRPFRLPGGDQAIKQPRRTALGLLYELFGPAAGAMYELAPVRDWRPVEKTALLAMLARPLNSPLTTSAGRLFDAVASLVGLRQHLDYEGQAAMELEGLVQDKDGSAQYGLSLQTGKPCLILDWAPMIHALLRDLHEGVAAAVIAAKFHHALAEAIVTVARHFKEPRVVLSGGCFQNHCLTEWSVRRLRAEKFQPAWPQQVPANDGGIALGQIFAARHHLTLK